MQLSNCFKNAIFYPCSGLDGYSLKLANLHLQDLNIQNHILVDYSISREDFLLEVQRISGYDVQVLQELEMKDLAPNGWIPRFPPMLDITNYKTQIDQWQARNNPFSFWVKLKRNDSFDVSHGPLEMNIIFIKGEAIATYQALRQNWNFTPIITILKSAGWGWGLGFEDFRRPNNSLDWILRHDLNNQKMLIATNENLEWDNVELIDEIAHQSQPSIRIYSV